MKNGVPDLRWANGKDLAVAVEGLFGKLFGPKTAGAGGNTAAKDKAAKKPEASKNAGGAKTGAEVSCQSCTSQERTLKSSPS
jgi:hypothetical protein